MIRANNNNKAIEKHNINFMLKEKEKYYEVIKINSEMYQKEIQILKIISKVLFIFIMFLTWQILKLHKKIENINKKIENIKKDLYSC